MKSLKTFLLSIVTLILVLLLGATVATTSTQAQDADSSGLLKVLNYNLVSEKRVGRTEFEYEYAITVKNNTNIDYDGVFVTLSTVSSTAMLNNPQVDIGVLNAFSEKAANDTIKVRVDRRARFNPENLIAAFDNDTLGGIDTDNNGVRDSVENYILDNFTLTDKEIELFLRIASFKQRAIEVLAAKVDLSADDIQDVGIAEVCFKRLNNSASEILMVTRVLTLDSDDRRLKEKEYRQNRAGIGLVRVPTLSELENSCSQ